MRRQVSVSQLLNRHSIKALRLDIQIEEANSEKFRQPCANCGLADAADADEEDAHVAPFGESLPNSGQSQVIRPSRDLACPQGHRLATAGHWESVAYKAGLFSLDTFLYLRHVKSVFTLGRRLHALLGSHLAPVLEDWPRQGH